MMTENEFNVIKKEFGYVVNPKFESFMDYKTYTQFFINRKYGDIRDMYQLGTRVVTKRGNGYITKIDKVTYSILLYIIRLTTGKFVNDDITLSEYEFTEAGISG